MGLLNLYGRTILSASALCLAAGCVSLSVAQSPGGAGTFTDSRYGKTYRTVKMGKQTWMAENLNIKIEGSWCYDNKESNCDKYGRLYNWNAAKKACPDGYKLPSRIEWNALVKFAGGEVVAGKKLKSTSGWNDRYKGGNGNGTNDFGFSALPGGYRSYDEDGSGSGFVGIGDYGGWWCATKSKNAHADWERGSGIYAWNQQMDSGWESVEEYDVDVTAGLSVRCVQDTTPQPAKEPSHDNP